MDKSDTIDLREVIGVVRNRWITVTVVLMCAVGLAAIASVVQKPKYDATATLLAGQGEGIADLQVISAINQATQSLARMATSRVVAEQTIDALEMKDELTPAELVGMASASVPANTQQIELTVRDTDANRAAELANSMARSFSEMVDERSKKSQLSATVWQPAVVPAAPSSPNVPLNIMLGILAGLVLGIAAAFVQEQLDTAWRDERDVEQTLGVPVLAVIPEISSRTAQERVYA